MTNIIIVAVLALVTIITFLGYDYYNLRRDKCRESTKISFKEGFDLTELPIVTFYSNHKKLHFLLDTGSNISYINSSLLKDLKVEDMDVKTNTIGAEGTGIETKHYLIDIGYKNQTFREEFGAINLDAAFGAIEKENGIKIHGILGSKFLEKYKYILNFKELTAYK